LVAPILVPAEPSQPPPVTSLGWQRKKSTVPVGVGVPERVAWSLTEVPGATLVAFVLACDAMSGGCLTVVKHSVPELVWSPER
jgi:hypothetical protein